MINRHPALIAQCRTREAVIAALGFARSPGADIAVPGGARVFEPEKKPRKAGPASSPVASRPRDTEAQRRRPPDNGTMARPDQAHGGRGRSPTGQQTATRRMRVADQLGQPPHNRALQVHVGVIARHGARVHRGSSERRQHTRKRRRRILPAKGRRVPVTHRMRKTSAAILSTSASSPNTPVRQRQRQQLRAQLLRHRLPDPLREQRREVIGYRVDERMTGPPGLL